MLINEFGESPFLVIDIMLGFCKSFTKGSLLFIQTVLAYTASCMARSKTCPHAIAPYWNHGQSQKQILSFSTVVEYLCSLCQDPFTANVVSWLGL